MQLRIAILLLAASMYAQQAQAPIPLTIPQQEEWSRVIIRLNAATIAFLQAQAEAMQQTQVYTATLNKLRADHHAEGCEIDSVSKVWTCPDKPQSKKKE